MHSQDATQVALLVKENIKGLKILQDDKDLIVALTRFGTSENIVEDYLHRLESFVCKLYG